MLSFRSRTHISFPPPLGSDVSDVYPDRMNEPASGRFFSLTALASDRLYLGNKLWVWGSMLFKPG